MIRVARSALEPLKPLAEGGMAKVYMVGGAVPQLPGKLVFKELKGPPAVTAANRTRMLDAMRTAVGLRDAMTQAERQELDLVTVWPLAMVEDGSGDIGLLMQCLSDDFFIDAVPSRRVFEFQLLGAGPEQAKKLGIEQSRKPADDDLVRLALMSHLAWAVEVIHRPRNGRRLVYGDLSLRNAAVAGAPPKIRPRILLMDCDGVADETDSGRLQPNTPFFVPPEIQSKQVPLQDQLTDVYKLGLCIIRGLARGRGSTQLADPASTLIPKGLLDQAGIDLLNRAIGADRAQRPTAEDIKDYLVGRVLDLAEPPTLISAQLSSDVALRGSEVFVHWAHKGGLTVRIFNTMKDLDETVGADAWPNGYPVKPKTAGDIFISVINKHGEDTGPVGRLHYYEIPPLKINLKPPPVVLEDLPTMQLPHIRPEIPPYPMHPADAVPLPQLTWPHVPALELGDVAPHAPFMNGLRNAVGRAYHAADRGVDAAVRDVLQKRAKKLREKAEKEAAKAP